MSLLLSEPDRKQVPPSAPTSGAASRDERTICWDCGKRYSGHLATDRRVHKDHHRRALTAPAELAGVGPLPLPITRTEWAELEKRAGGWSPNCVEEAIHRLWLEYARSLSPDYDVKRHIDWRTWVLIQLGRDIGTSDEDQVLFPRFDLDIRKSLIARFGEPILYYGSISDLRRARRRRARR
jgi:hypothetical protein